MKRYLLFLALIITFTLQAQAPQGFNYQATVRNSAGDLIVNTNVYFKFNVMQGSQTSLPVFTEIHYVPTDDLGQVNLVIGQGTAIEGVFSELDWSLGSYYLGIELDTGSGYVAMGTTQLLSVPYADPTDAQDAVTKAYIDAQIAEAVAGLQSQIDDLDSDNNSGSVTDQDGNTYDYLTYGNQVWTVENAEMVTYQRRYAYTTSYRCYRVGKPHHRCLGYYDNDPTKPRLYNWYAVMGIHDNRPKHP